MGISYDSGTNTIIVTGDNAGNPWTFEDIYQADVNNGWGKVTKPAANVYIFEAKLQIGDGSTATSFADTDKTVIFRNVASAAGEIIITVKNNAEFRLGELYDLESGRVKGGCTIAFEDNYNQLRLYGESNSVVKLYGLTFYNSSDRETRVSLSGRIREIVNCRIYGTLNAGSADVVRFLRLAHNTGEISGFQLSDARYVDVFSTAGCLYASYSNSVVVKNGRLYGEKLANIGNAWSGKIELIDCDILNEVITWNGTSWNGGRVYIKYTVTVRALDKDGNPVQGAVVSIVDRNGNLISQGQTDTDGKFSDVILVREHYPDTSVAGPPYPDIVVNYDPITIAVWKDGYDQFVLKTAVIGKLDVEAVLRRQGLMFGSLAFANRFQNTENVVLAVDLYTLGGVPVSSATVQVKIVKPDGTVVQDWTTMTSLGDGVYVLDLGQLPEGIYIVKYKATYGALTAEGADTVQVVRDVELIRSDIKRLRLLTMSKR